MGNDAAKPFDDLWKAEAADDEFDPLAVDDGLIDQEEMDDDNPLDTVDFPTMRNMPEGMRREGVYTLERMGGAEAAVRSLLDHNPARRPVLLAILGWCEDGCATSELTRRVDEAQEHNRSVYAPTTLCRMLEWAGALELEMPETSDAREDAAEGVEYLEIRERVDPVWRSTPEGLAVRESLTQGTAFRDIVLGRDVRYASVYRAVMEAVERAPRSKAYIDALVDAFPEVQSPRRFGGHFVDMLERTDALEWRDRAWRLTDLGRSLLPDVRELAEARAASSDPSGKES